MKILLIEDEIDLNNIIAKLLKKNGFSVDSAFDGMEALEYVAISEYDLIILDVMMPKLDGFGFIKKFREKDSSTYVLMLTAKNDLKDKIEGLDLGADDYLTKPFEFEELLARIRAMLRRGNNNVSGEIVKIRHIEINLTKKEVKKQEGDMWQIVDLTSKEYEVLEYLLRNKNHILSRTQIREHVWDFDYEGESNIIDVLIKNIRRKLDDKNSDSLIQTKRGMGYVIKEETK